MPGFRHRTRVMFQHCDPAAIVFYPRYFEMLNELVETFFGDAMDWSFHRMHAVERVGVPMGRIETEFHAASRLGDVLDWKLTITRLGGASLDFTARATCGSEPRLTARGTLVLVDLDRMSSIRWSEDRRDTFKTYLED